MSTRREIIGDATLYLGDCREILPALGKVDAVVTDPPYLIRNKFGIQNKLNGVRRLQFHFDHTTTRDEVLNSISDACQKSDAFFIFCGVSLISYIDKLLSEKFTVKPAVWIKSCPPPAMPGNWWPSGFEHALYGYVSGAWFGNNNSARRNVFYSDTYRHGIRGEEKVDHPTQKWLPLIAEIVGSVVSPIGTCLDPFMGSGTTGVACVMLGRKFIGIEIEPKYFDIACRRIEAACKQPDMFIDRPQPAKQERLL